MKKQFILFEKIILPLMFLLFLLGCSETQSNNTDASKNELLKKVDSVNKVLDKFDSKINNQTKSEDENINEITISEQNDNLTNQSYKKEGKPDTIVIEFDTNNKLLIPGMLPSAYADENPTSDMFVSYSFLQKHDTITFTLGEISGIDGNIEGNELFFETDKKFKLIRINCNAFAGIYFNEDGSGGTWQEFKNSEYGKEPLKQVEEKIYEVSTFEGIAEIVPNEIIEKADKKTDKNDLLSYDIYISKMLVEIQYSISGKKFKKVLVFNYEYGD